MTLPYHNLKVCLFVFYFFIGWNGKQHSKDCVESWKLCRSREKERRTSLWLQDILAYPAFIHAQSETKDQWGLLNQSWTLNICYLKVLLCSMKIRDSCTLPILEKFLLVADCCMPWMFCWSDPFDLSVGFSQPIYKQTVLICFCLHG